MKFQSLYTTLRDCVHPLKVEKHIATKLVNTYIGEDDSENVNITESVKSWIQQMTDFC